MEIEKCAPKPVELYRRRIWLSVLLTLLGPGLPIIYCGKLKLGIIVESASFVFLLLVLLIRGTILNITGFIVFFTLVILLSVFYLVFNIMYTIRSNKMNYPRVGKTWLWIMSVFVAPYILWSFVSFLLDPYFAEIYAIPATSMEPSLLVGDRLVASKHIDLEKLKIGDVVIFKWPIDPTQNYVKRVIGKEGDKITITRKQVYLNGAKLEEPYAKFFDSRELPFYERSGFWGMGVRDNMPEIEVPENAYFVLGDNRDNSADSRYWGFLPESLVIGQARYICFSWDSEKSRVRWDRIGKRLD